MIIDNIDPKPSRQRRPDAAGRTAARDLGFEQTADSAIPPLFAPAGKGKRILLYSLSLLALCNKQVNIELVDRR